MGVDNPNAKILDDFTGEAVLIDGQGNHRAYLLYDRQAVKAIDKLIPRGSMHIATTGVGSPSECVTMIMCGSVGYQRRNRGAMRITDEEQAWDVMRACGGPFQIAAVLTKSLGCAEDLGLRDPEASDGDAAGPLVPPSS